MNGSGKHNLKEKMTTTIRVYNGTGEELSFVDKHDWEGYFDVKPPAKIGADTEAVFGITSSGGSNQTKGAVVYSSASLGYDCMVAFYGPNAAQKKVLCRCGKPGSFTSEVMGHIENDVTTSGKQFDGKLGDDDDVVVTMASITQEEDPKCLAIMGKYVKNK